MVVGLPSDTATHVCQRSVMRGLIHAPWLAPTPALTSAGVVLGRDYPAPVVNHDEARIKTLARYAVVKQSK